MLQAGPRGTIAPSLIAGCLPWPFKVNQHRRRRHIPKRKHTVTNSAAYDASLCQRGSLTMWLTGEAVAAWKVELRRGRYGQRWYSPLAILTALTHRAVSSLALRQTEGLIGPSTHPFNSTLVIPDHTTLRRRLQISADTDTGQFVAAAPTTKDVDDGCQIGPLLGQAAALVASFTADGAYDQEGVSAAAAKRNPKAAIIVPPHSMVVTSNAAGSHPPCSPTPSHRSCFQP